MEFKKIPAGSFFMGSCSVNHNPKGLPVREACPSGANADLRADEDEVPQHKVVISKAFQLSIYEVTVKQFEKFIGDSGRTDLLSAAFRKANSDGSKNSVTHISWQDAQDFLVWLNKNKPLTDTGSYRLPTEAEWEYAARAGTNTQYSFGDEWSATKHSRGIASVSIASEAGTATANPWGLYGMHGDIWEWTQDWYDEIYYSSGNATDPTGPSVGKARVIRGGRWYKYVRYCRSANRSCAAQDYRDFRVGMRVVREF